jgi:hypothetical protein
MVRTSRALGPSRAVGVGVQEAGDVAAPFLALEGPGAVELDAGPVAAGTPHAPAVPDPAAPLAQERPALFDNRL